MKFRRLDKLCVIGSFLCLMSVFSKWIIAGTPDEWMSLMAIAGWLAAFTSSMTTVLTRKDDL